MRFYIWYVMVNFFVEEIKYLNEVRSLNVLDVLLIYVVVDVLLLRVHFDLNFYHFHLAWVIFICAN